MKILNFFQIQVKVYLESHRGRKSESAGLCRLRKQVTEAKEGPLELRRKQRYMPLGKKKRGKGMGILQRGEGRRRGKRAGGGGRGGGERLKTL